MCCESRKLSNVLDLTTFQKIGQKICLSNGILERNRSVALIHDIAILKPKQI